MNKKVEITNLAGKMDGRILCNERRLDWGLKSSRSNLLRVKNNNEVKISLFLIFKNHFSKFGNVMTFSSLIGLVSNAFNGFFWEFNHYLIKFIEVGNNFLLWFSSLFIGMIVPYLEFSPLSTAFRHCNRHLITYILLAPISNPFWKNCV